MAQPSGKLVLAHPAGPQEWKRARLIETGRGVPEWLRFVPIDFEAGERWRAKLVQSGSDESKPAVVVSTGVSMYLRREANEATMREVAGLAPGSMLEMTFCCRSRWRVKRCGRGWRWWRRARGRAGERDAVYQLLYAWAMALDAGFKEARHVSADELAELYFAGRGDGLRPPANAEELLIAGT